MVGQKACNSCENKRFGTLSDHTCIVCSTFVMLVAYYPPRIYVWCCEMSIVMFESIVVAVVDRVAVPVAVVVVTVVLLRRFFGGSVLAFLCLFGQGKVCQTQQVPLQ